jgi:HAMP domain-containing protein/HPt (histidine-containing phosphotransfer) domain-containing protein
MAEKSALWDALAQRIDAADAGDLTELTTSVRDQLDKLNEDTGLLIDGDASSSRLLDIVTTHLPGLIEANGRVAQIGSIVLVKKSVRGSRRTDLTLQRGNFDALVQWSMDNLQKVARKHPEQARNLDDAASRLNQAYLGVQEAMTVKMLDSQDFDMTPEELFVLTSKAFDETLAIGGIVATETGLQLTDRIALLELQRNVVIVAMVLGLLLVAAGFMAAYISIMRGLNNLSDAVNNMAGGDLSARVEMSSRDEIGAIGTQFNQMVESLAERTAELHEKTNDMHTMLQNMPQGILTIIGSGSIHPEYSAYLETIFETKDVAGQSASGFIFSNGSVGADEVSQVEATISACLGEDSMNFAMNSHLLVNEVFRTLPDGRIKCLELNWSTICDDDDLVEKIMVCVRDVTELRKLEAEAGHQKRELEMIGHILAVNQEKFSEFIESARGFVAANETLLTAADVRNPDLITQLFRNMHTIKGNARTYGLLHLTNIVHEAEQAYDELRNNSETPFDKHALLAQLQDVLSNIEEYASLNDAKLGRKGPGRRGSAEKYVMVQRTHVDQMIAELGAYDLQAARQETLAALLSQIKLDLKLIGTEPIQNILGGVFESLPSLAKELGKEPPQVEIADHGIHIKNQVTDLLRNVFMHLYRNSMDHGIEVPADRLANGKSARGTIWLNMSLSNDRLVMRLHDDGKGLALGYIRNKAIEKALIAPDGKLADEEVARLIFAAGFSTASAVTEVSGRGVGMDAVRDFVTRENGTIELKLLDDKTGADYRAFETVISLPGKFAVDAGQKSPKLETHSDHPKLNKGNLHEVRLGWAGQLAEI